MIINKNNQQIIGANSLSVNDLFMTSFEFIVKEEKIIIEISNYNGDDIRHTIIFEKVFKFEFSSIKGFKQNNCEELYEWEMIPNKYANDDFIEETKKLYIANGGDWNENLFAIRLLMSNMNEIKIIAERIHFIK